MTVVSDELTETVLALSSSQRATLANTLLVSLENHTDNPGDVQTAWTAEIGSRIDDILSGRVQTIPWEQVNAQIAADLAARPQ